MVALQEVNASSSTHKVYERLFWRRLPLGAVLRLSLEWEFELRSTAAMG